MLKNLFAFIVCHRNVVVDGAFWNTFFPTHRACVLEHAGIMNALNMIACRNSAIKPLLTYFTRVLVFFWVKQVLRLFNKLKQILRLWEIHGRSYNRKKYNEIGLLSGFHCFIELTALSGICWHDDSYYSVSWMSDHNIYRDRKMTQGNEYFLRASLGFPCPCLISRTGNKRIIHLDPWEYTR